MIPLPSPIAAYFTAANARDPRAAASCFAEDAIVKDEGQDRRGRAEIEAWKARALEKYRYTVEPLSAETKDGATVVTGRVTGDFPGSPVDLRHTFTLAGDTIARLEIKP